MAYLGNFTGKETVEEAPAVTVVRASTFEEVVADVQSEEVKV